MTPAFRVVVGGQDRTSVLADRLLSITVTDEDGGKADRVEIVLDDRDGRLAFPEIDARLEVALGFAGAPLNSMGIYAVDQVSGEGPVQTLTITATAADLKGEIRAPRTRAWERQSLGSIVGTIAAAAGLRPVIGESLRGLVLPFVAQTAESDLHFLTRIASGLDATCKPAGGALVMQRRGEGKTAAGDTLIPAPLVRHRFAEWSWSFDGRSVYPSAEAQWTDVASGATRTVRAGQGRPVKVIRHPYPTEAEARQAAEAAVAGAGRGGMTLNAQLAGFEPALLGGGLAEITGVSPWLAGVWHLSSVTHEFTSGGLATSFEACRPSDKTTPTTTSGAS